MFLLWAVVSLLTLARDDINFTMAREVWEGTILCSLSLSLYLLPSQDPLPEYGPGVGGPRSQNQR